MDSALDGSLGWLCAQESLLEVRRGDRMCGTRDGTMFSCMQGKPLKPLYYLSGITAPILFFFSFCLLGHTHCVQALLLTLCSMIILGSVQGIIYDASN